VFLHGVYVKAIADTAIRTTATWAYVPPAVDAGAGRWRRYSERIVVAVYAGMGLAAIVGTAFACMALGIAWTVIAVLVLAGTAQSALRLSGLDPLGMVLGSGETLRGRPAPVLQGFGGRDVEVDSRTPAPYVPATRLTWRPGGIRKATDDNF